MEAKAKKVERTTSSYIRFNVQDYFKINDAAGEKGEDRLIDIIKPGMHIGCRFDELCHM